MSESKIVFIGGGELLVEVDTKTLGDRLESSGTVALTKARADDAIVYVRSEAVAYVEEAKKSKGALGSLLSDS